MTNSTDKRLEKAAIAAAFWHGQKIVAGGLTRAALRGYGSWGTLRPSS